MWKLLRNVARGFEKWQAYRKALGSDEIQELRRRHGPGEIIIVDGKVKYLLVRRLNSNPLFYTAVVETEQNQEYI